MKNLNRVLFAAAIAATLGLANNASAQYKPTGNDRITASPKLRQMLNERAVSAWASVYTTAVTVTYRAPGLEGVTASPKLRQMLAERKIVVSGATAVEAATAAYSPTGTDGITASPKLRAQLNERSAPIIIAPLK